jgi:hypothetical protein
MGDPRMQRDTDISSSSALSKISSLQALNVASITAVLHGIAGVRTTFGVSSHNANRRLSLLDDMFELTSGDRRSLLGGRPKQSTSNILAFSQPEL